MTPEQRLRRKTTDAARYERNRDSMRAKNKLWRDNNPERMAACRKAWVLANPDRVKEKIAEWGRNNPDKIKAKRSKWARENPHEVNARNAKRRATQIQATPEWADEFIIVEAYELAQSRSKATGVTHHVDHIVPLISRIVCGLHCEFNVRVIPETENVSKGNRHWPDMP